MIMMMTTTTTTTTTMTTTMMMMTMMMIQNIFTFMWLVQSRCSSCIILLHFLFLLAVFFLTFLSFYRYLVKITDCWLLKGSFLIPNYLLLNEVLPFVFSTLLSDLNIHIHFLPVCHWYLTLQHFLWPLYLVGTWTVWQGAQVAECTI